MTVIDSFGFRATVGLPIEGSKIAGSVRTVPGGEMIGLRMFATSSSWFCSKSSQFWLASVL